MIRFPRSRVAAFAVAFVGLCQAAPAQEKLGLGRMWTFENPPLAYLKQEYGFTPTREWFDMLRLAALRFGDGCSASFVSPKGLIMTNHHCARDRIAEVAPPDQDWVKHGFYAGALADEVHLPGLEVQQLVAMKDVTEAMNRGIEPGDDAGTATAKRAMNEQDLLEAAELEHAGLEPQLVSLFQGAQYQLYLYRTFDDIRLVCSPHLQAAYFGGDPDNFTYPRYCLDFAFVRAYQDGRPADTSGHYFRWNSNGAKEGDLVFVVGNPGSTDRLLTKAQMEYHRDAELPLTLQSLRGQLAMLEELLASSPESEMALREITFSLSNSQKALTGEHEGLLEPSLLQQKAEAEAEFRARIDGDPALRAKYGTLFDKLDANARAWTALLPRLAFQQPGESPHLHVALAIVRAFDPDAEESERAIARAQAMGASPFESYADLAAKAFAADLELAHRWLPADDPMIRLLMPDGDAKAAAARIAMSKVLDDGFRRTLIEQGAEAITLSEDPAIVVARMLAPLMRENQKLAARLEADKQAYGTAVGRALFDVHGTMVSPDATFTLRFSDGVVKGYPFNGTIAPWRTVFGGMFGRNVDFAGKPPFDLPEVMLAARDRLDLKAPVNFVSTNDITGGNSGSPMVDRDLNIVGLIFDGNIESLPNRFLFRTDRARTVSVHAGGIIEALRKIYDAGALADELEGRAR